MVTLLLEKGIQRDIADKVSYVYYVEPIVDDEMMIKEESGKRRQQNKYCFFKTICAALA